MSTSSSRLSNSPPACPDSLGHAQIQFGICSCPHPVRDSQTPPLHAHTQFGTVEHLHNTIIFWNTTEYCCGILQNTACAILQNTVQYYRILWNTTEYYWILRNTIEYTYRILWNTTVGQYMRFSKVLWIRHYVGCNVGCNVGSIWYVWHEEHHRVVGT